MPLSWTCDSIQAWAHCEEKLDTEPSQKKSLLQDNQPFQTQIERTWGGQHPCPHDCLYQITSKREAEAVGSRKEGKFWRAFRSEYLRCKASPECRKISFKFTIGSWGESKAVGTMFNWQDQDMMRIDWALVHSHIHLLTCNIEISLILAESGTDGKNTITAAQANQALQSCMAEGYFSSAESEDEV